MVSSFQLCRVDLSVTVKTSMSSIWEEICNLVIRPQRCIYDSNVMLGPRLFMLGNKIFERKDFEITNKRKYKIKCSHYMPIESQRKAEKLPCVVYLHGNCGSRCDAIDTVQLLLPYDITVFSFDFAGSGLSEGEYVSLGFFEQHDVVCVINHLRKEGRTSKIGLWGRSMGAATALIVSNIVGKSVSGIVCDSPFSSLENVIIDLVKKYGKVVPKRFTKVGIKMMKRSIMNRAGFDIYQNNPIVYCREADTPALFGAAFDDNFIQMSQSEKIFEEYGGEKTFVRFDGDHNSERPDYFYESVSIFFYNVLISNDRTLKFDDPQKKKKREKQKRKLRKEKLRERARARAKRELETFALSDDSSGGEDGVTDGIEDAIRKVSGGKKKMMKKKKLRHQHHHRRKKNRLRQKGNLTNSLPSSPITKRKVRTHSSSLLGEEHEENDSNEDSMDFVRKRNYSAGSEELRKHRRRRPRNNITSSDEEETTSTSTSENEDGEKKGNKNRKKNDENIQILQSSSFREKNKQQIVVPKSLNDKEGAMDLETLRKSGLMKNGEFVDVESDEEDEDEGEVDDDENNAFSEERRREIEMNLSFKNF